MSASEELLQDADGVVRIFTLHRPAAYNALSSALLRELSAALTTCVADPGVRAVVITGSGTKAFSAGADLGELKGLSAEDAHSVLAAGQQLLQRLEALPVPVVAAVNGLALGGGFELTLACTLMVSAETASFGLPEAGLGLIPGYGGTQRLPRLVGRANAAHLMLTGDRLSAARAYELGLLATAPVPPDELQKTALALAHQIAGRSPQAVRAILTALRLGADCPIETGLALESALAALAVASTDAAEGIGAFLEKRVPAFQDRA